MSKIRILLADDHALMRKGLASLLEKERDLEVIGEAANGREAQQKIRQDRPHIVLMDLSMPELNGLEATRQIKKDFPQVQILVLTMHKQPEYLLEVLRAGASGFVIKQAAPHELVEAIRTLSQGQVFLSPAVSGKLNGESLPTTPMLARKEGPASLTPRESEILQLIAEGYSNREIADRLHVSVKTVETHRGHLMGKLNLHSVAELTQYAVRKGIISLEG